jgi:hypothetical protein
MATLPWTAPQSLPTTDGTATIQVTQLQLRRMRDVPSFFAAALRIRRQMLNSPGNMGVSLLAKPLRRTFWTVSAWQDQPAISAAIAQNPHLQTMKQFRMAGSAFVRWTVPDTALPITWKDVMHHLEQPDTVYRHD